MEEIHLGIIPDGNRRWAKKRGLEPWKGHIYGAKKVEKVLKWCFELGIRKVSFYLLSYENMIKRSKKELENIFKLLENYLEKWEKEKLYEKYEVRINFLGNFRKIPKSLVKLMLRISKKSLKFSKRILNFLIGYSGTYDTIQAVKKMIKNRVKIIEKNLKKFLLVKDDVDLIIRTGGYSRLSNFLPLQSSYAEIYVLNKYWPEITKKDLIKALNWYKRVQRNFGK
jgi:tritrans,polycis-undecaprenyl-diphosphate synthase [geranylgeranyl-diphosphate specific]